MEIYLTGFVCTYIIVSAVRLMLAPQDKKTLDMVEVVCASLLWPIVLVLLTMFVLVELFYVKRR